MSRADAEIVLDIVAAARLIAKFIRGIDRNAFRSDELRRSAVIHQLLVLGEASKHLSVQFRTDHPEIPWSEMAGMRDRLIHAYHKIDVDRVTEAAFDKLPRVLEVLEPLAPKEND